MAIFKEDIVAVELQSGTIQRSFLNHSIGSGDKMANRFGVSLFRNGEPVSAESATVAGVFMAPDGNNYAISETGWPGSTGKDGNTAWVQLPEICYAVPGQFCLAIKLSGGSVEGTMRIVDGVVADTGETGAVVPTSTIPTTEDIIEAYEEAIESVGKAVRFDVEQSLTSAQKKQARENIDVENIANSFLKRSGDSVTDLNALYEPGWYSIPASAAVSNIPEPSGTVGQRIVVIYPVPSGDTPTSASLRMMEYVNFTTGVRARRLYVSGAWQNWENEFAFNPNPSLDLDDFFRNGWYVIPSAEDELLNSPEPDGTTGQRQIYVFAQEKANANTYRFMYYTNAATGVMAVRLYTNNAWGSWMPMTDYHGFIADGTDLNTLYENGWYTVATASGLTNAPEETGTQGQRIVWIMAASAKPGSGTLRYMFYYNKATEVFATRLYVSGAWQDWTISWSMIRELQEGDDLDDLYRNGWYMTGSTRHYLHTPESDTTVGRRQIYIFSRNKPASTTYRVMYYINIDTQVTAYRLFASGAWGRWTRDDWTSRTRSQIFTPAAQAGQGENTGDLLRVMSYNVARYNNNTETYLPDGKLFNLRKVVGQINADIIAVQEDLGTIDGSSKSSHDYIYKPQYPYQYRDGAWANLIYSKHPASTSGRVKYTQYGGQYRGIEYAVFDIGAKKVLVCSSHTSWNDTGDGGESPEAVAVRKAQYEELFGWVTGQNTMTDYTTSAAVSVPAHTHCIICMDGNSATDDDKDNLTETASDNDFILGNGGAMGWFITNPYTEHCLDQIAVSDNIIINNIESYGDLFNRLYSDHVPVAADLTLL